MNNENGYALVLSIIILAVLIIILTAMSSLVANETDFVVHDKNTTETFYTAEAGLEYATMLLSTPKLNDSEYWDQDTDELHSDYIDYLNNNLNDDVTLNSVKILSIVDNDIKIRSHATHNNGQDKIITVEYHKSPVISEAYNYSLVANGDIDVKNKVIIEGFTDDGNDDDQDFDLDNDGIDDYIDDEVDIDNDGIHDMEDQIIDIDGDGVHDYDDEDGIVNNEGETISNTDLDNDGIDDDPDRYPDYFGDVYTTGLVSDKSKTDFIQSDYTDSSEDPDIKDIIPNIYTEVYNHFEDQIGDPDPDTGDNVYQDVLSLKDPNTGEYNFDEEVAYLNNSITFKNGEVLTGNGILLVDGDITFNNGVDISTAENENLLIIASGSITFKNSSQFNGLVYSQDKIYIKAKVDVVGTVMSKISIEEDTITVNSGGNDPSKIDYDRGYLDLFEQLGINVPPVENELGYELSVVSWEED